MRQKNRVLAIYGILNIFICIIFALVIFSFLAINSRNFAREFYSQNFRAIESADSFSLIAQLNSLQGQETIHCIRGFYQGTQFFFSGQKCEDSIFSKTIQIDALNKKIHIIFVYGLSQTFILSIFSIFFFSVVFSSLALAMLFHIQDLENRFMASFNSLAMRVGHDIRSPLSALSILNAVEDLNTPEARRLLNASSKRINSIAQDLLDKGRDPTSCALKIQKFDISKLMYELIEEKKLEFSQKHNLKLDIVVKEKELIGESDKTELVRILSNLINNSVEASTDIENPSVRLLVQGLPNYIEIIVMDNGKGMPKNVLKQLGKLKASTGKKGFGIGTYYAFEIIKRMGGSIAFQSEIAKGTSVSIRIPRVTLATSGASDKGV